MSGMGRIIRGGERVGLSHYHLDAAQWEALLRGEGATLPLLSCWADEGRVHVLLLEGDCPLMASTGVEDRRYLAPSLRFPAAEWGERVAYDLYGVEAMGSAGDGRHALDGGVWQMTWPLAERPGPGGAGVSLPEGRQRIEPERSGTNGALGVSFDVIRGRVSGLTCEAGLSHRGVLHRMIGLTPEEALPLVSRLAGGSFVAHPLAFCRAVAQARGVLPGPGVRDCWQVLLEIERISVHLYDMARLARCVGAGLLATHCEQARQALSLRCVEQGVSRRLTDVVRCGGVRADLEIVPLAQAVVSEMGPRLGMIAELQRVFAPRMVGLAVLSPELARRFAIGGIVGRASGRSLDLRRREAGMRLDALRSTGAQEGDAAARAGLRVTEMRDSLALIQRILGTIGAEDDEPVLQGMNEGIGAAEGARGDIWAWVRLKEGKIEAVHVRDPASSLLSVLGKVFQGERPERIEAGLMSLAVSPAGMAL